MGEPQQPPDRNGHPEPPSGTDILDSGRDTACLSERWTALPRRTRRRLLAAATAAVLAAGTGYALAARPREPEPPPVAYPAQTTDVIYLWITHPAPQPAPREASFLITLRATSTSPVTVEHIAQGYEGLRLTLTPHPPVQVTPARPRTLTLLAEVTRCAGLPREARLPFLDVTLRNSRARQKLSVIPGDRYAHDLTHVFRTVCGPPEPTRTATP